MRKRTQILAPALVVGLMLLGGYGLTSHPASPAQSAAAQAEVKDAPAPAFLAAAGGQLDQVQSATDPIAKASASAEPTMTASPTATSTATPEPTATLEPTATATPRPTMTPQPTATPRPTAAPQLAAPDHISAPTIGLDAKVVTVGWHEVLDGDGKSHTEWDVASYAAGWHKNSAKPGQVGNVVLSGHNNIEGEVFRNLEKFQVGDRITLYVGGRTFDYYVTDKFAVLDKDVPYEQRVQNARWIGQFADERLTLVSCWPPTNNTHRMFVIAKPRK